MYISMFISISIYHKINIDKTRYGRGAKTIESVGNIYLVYILVKHDICLFSSLNCFDNVLYVLRMILLFYLFYNK